MLKSKARTGTLGALARPLPARRHGSVRGLWLVPLLAAALSSCAQKVSTAIKSCPCATGNVCCDSGICAADQASCGSATLALARESAGTWTGYLENFELQSGSDALRIAVTVSGDVVAGEVVLGNGTPMTPDAAVYSQDGGAYAWGIGLPFRYFEGVAYQARNLRWENRRLKFDADLRDGWYSRCALYQAAFHIDGQSLVCPPSWTMTTENGVCQLPDGTRFDCALLTPCDVGSVCRCEQTQCVPDEFVGTLQFDIALDGDSGNGSALGLDPFTQRPVNVRLNRTGP